MKKAILVVLIIAVTASPAMPMAINQLSKNIAGCLCGGQGAAFNEGCRAYMSSRLQLGKAPDQALAKAERTCEYWYPNNPAKVTKCKEAAASLKAME